jgi:hypothetical protein
MANIKRKERMSELHRLKLGRYKLTRKDVLVVEKLLRIYANTYEKRRATRFKREVVLSSKRKVAKRSFADMHVLFSGVRADSVKFLPKTIKRRLHYSFELRCNPGMWVRFTPLRTIIGMQVLYATGEELRSMQEVASKIETYIRAKPKSIVNICDLTK